MNGAAGAVALCKVRNVFVMDAYAACVIWMHARKNHPIKSPSFKIELFISMCGSTHKKGSHRVTFPAIGIVEKSSPPTG